MSQSVNGEYIAMAKSRLLVHDSIFIQSYYDFISALINIAFIVTCAICKYYTNAQFLIQIRMYYLHRNIENVLFRHFDLNRFPIFVVLYIGFYVSVQFSLQIVLEVVLDCCFQNGREKSIRLWVSLSKFDLLYKYFYFKNYIKFMVVVFMHM